MGREAVRESVGTSTEPTITGNVLAIEQRTGSDVTLDSMDPREEYLKLELIEHTVDI